LRKITGNITQGSRKVSGTLPLGVLP